MFQMHLTTGITDGWQGGGYVKTEPLPNLYFGIYYSFGLPDVWPSGWSARFMSGRSLFVWFESRPGRAKTLKIGTCFSLAKRSA